jgi:predicted glutamine amidotransferase
MCNLAGYSGNKPANVDKMKLLFIYGSNRGKDGFGVIINNKAFRYCGYDKGVDFSNSYNVVHGSIIHETKNVHTIISHNRAKSVGNININNVHPFEYSTIEGKKVYFAHNGTISNIDELADKYNIKMSTGEVDSKVLGEIIYKYGFDILKEYTGFAAFSYYDVQEDALYLWKGMSQCDSATITEERPLHFYQNKSKSQLYYASCKITLSTALNIHQDSIEELPGNTLVKIINGKIVETTLYDRSHIVYTPKSTYGYGGYSNAWGYDNYYKKDNKDNKDKNTNKTNNVNVKTRPVVSEFFKLDDEENPQNTSKGCIYFWKGLYYVNGHIMNGVYRVDANNKPVYVDKSIVNNANENAYYYFVSGYLIKDFKSYCQLLPISNFKTWNVHSKQSYIHPKAYIFSELFYQSLDYAIFANNGILKDYHFVKPIFATNHYYNANGVIMVSVDKNNSVIQNELEFGYC